jgi:uncharacterized membrane protein
METIEEKMYEKAVNGYNFHVKRYGTWTNLYAIFVGAFFIAYYNVSCNDFLSILIACMGLITSICWLGSFHGYYSWLKSWTRILHYHEEVYLESTKEPNKKDNRVYTLISKGNAKWLGFSTQRITLKFIWAVVISWMVLLTHGICHLLVNLMNGWCICLWSIAIFIVFAAILFAAVIAVRRSLLSDVDTMYRLEVDNNKYRIEDPEKKIEYIKQ